MSTVFIIDMLDGTTLFPFKQDLESVLEIAKKSGERVRLAPCGSFAAAAAPCEIVWTRQEAEHGQEPTSLDRVRP